MFQHGALRSLLFNGLLIFVVGRSVNDPLVVKFGHSEIDVNLTRAEDIPKKTPFRLEDIYEGQYNAYGFNGSWAGDNIVFADRYLENIYEYEIATGEKKLILDMAGLSKYPDASLTFSSDGSYVLVGYDSVSGYRHSVYRRYVVHNIQDKTCFDIADGKELPLVKWSPEKNAIVYVLKNDIYYQDFTHNNTHVVRLTNTGECGTVFNGVPDWVYEEEVLGGPSALWFSPTGQYLAFATFNDTNVKDAKFLYYGKPGSLVDQYPREVDIKYPKAGSPNPIVSLNIIDLTAKPKVLNLKAPVDVVGEDNILYSVTWRDENHVLATWTNRVQNQSQYVLYDTQGVLSYAFYDKETEGWLRIKPVFHHKQYAIIMKNQDIKAKAGKYLHATRFEYKDGKLIGELDLTPGPTEINNLVTIDHERGLLYYLATRFLMPGERNLYVVPIDGSRKPECVSCGYITPEGHNCTFAAASFSMDKSYYALTCTGPDPSTVAIFDVNHNLVLMWEDNKMLREKLDGRLQPIKNDIYLSVNGFYHKIRLLLPPDMQYYKKYPLLINIYAGPGSARVNDAMSIGYHTYMTTNRSVVYGWIDGRGSANRGTKMLYEVYRRLGTVEIKDQISVMKMLLAIYPWIDASKTGIWGWSYGGYATGMVLATDKDSVFKCGISVAPVSSWIYYDSIYTERYMGLPTPEDNLRGYNETDLTRKVEGIRGKKFMLIHGTGDDNVHFQQAMALAKALERDDILFEQQVYTDEAHSLHGVTGHLYHTMDRFWEECLGLSSFH